MDIDFYSEFQDNIVNSYDNEMGAILHKYQFILEDEFDFEFPESPKARFDLLIESTSRFHFIEAKYAFLRSTLGVTNILQIEGEIAKLKNVIEPPKGEGHLNSKTTYSDAIVFMYNSYNSFFQYFPGSIKSSNNNSQDEYIISLIHNKYFHKVSLPEAAYYIDYKYNVRGLTLIAEVYGKYYLFYNYLLALKDKIKQNSGYNILDELTFKGNSDSESDVNSFIDRFRANFTKKNVELCKKIVSQLSVEHNTCSLKTLKNQPVLKRHKGESDFKVNVTLRARKGIIAALVNYLIDTGCWKHIGISKRHIEANRIFQLDYPSHSMFSKKQQYSEKVKGDEYRAIEEILDPIIKEIK